MTLPVCIWIARIFRLVIAEIGLIVLVRSAPSMDYHKWRKYLDNVTDEGDAVQNGIDPIGKYFLYGWGVHFGGGPRQHGPLELLSPGRKSPQRKGNQLVMEKGWIEQRRHDRISATANITYRVLEAEEKQAALQIPRYSETTIVHLPHLAKKFHSYHAVLKDISEGGLSITGDQKFNVGEWIEVSILPPKYASPVTMLAEIRWTRSFTQMGKEQNSAGVIILALDSVSMNQLSRFLLSEKIRRDNENR